MNSHPSDRVLPVLLFDACCHGSPSTGWVTMPAHDVQTERNRCGDEMSATNARLAPLGLGSGKAMWGEPGNERLLLTKNLVADILGVFEDAFGSLVAGEGSEDPALKKVSSTSWKPGRNTISWRTPAPAMKGCRSRYCSGQPASRLARVGMARPRSLQAFIPSGPVE